MDPNGEYSASQQIVIDSWRVGSQHTEVENQAYWFVVRRVKKKEASSVGHVHYVSAVCCNVFLIRLLLLLPIIFIFKIFFFSS